MSKSHIQAKAKFLRSNPTFKTLQDFIKHGNEHFKKYPIQDEHLGNNALEQFGFKRAHIDYNTGATDVRGPLIVKPKPFNELGFSNTNTEDYFEEIDGLINNLGIWGSLGLKRKIASEV